MRHVDERLRKLGWALHAGAGTALVAGAALLHVLLLHPLDRQDAELRARVDEVETLLDQAADVRDRHRQLQQALEELQRRSEAVRRRVPDEPNEAEFLSDVARIADRRQVRVHDYRLGATSPAGDYSQMTVQLSLEGTYEGICGFLDELMRLPRLMTIERISVKSVPQQHALPVELTLVLYFGLQAKATT